MMQQAGKHLIHKPLAATAVKVKRKEPISASVQHY